MSPRADRVQGRRAHGGVLLVPCLINEAYRYWFLADTGAAITMLSHQAAEEMGLEVSSPFRQERIASVHQTASAPVIRLSSIQVGSCRLTDFEAIVLPLPVELRVDGLLGVNFLQRFRPTFEFGSSVLVLR